MKKTHIWLDKQGIWSTSALALPLALTLTLAGCDTSGLPTAEQVAQVELSIQNAAKATCKAAPTIETIGLIVAGLVAGGTAISQVANVAVNQFCTLVVNAPAPVQAQLKAVAASNKLAGKLGAPVQVGEWKGYPIYADPQ